MSDWRFQGSAQRRRMGASSSHLNSAGGAVARSNIPDPAEALAGMARVGNPRMPMGTAGFSFNDASGAPSKYTTPVQKKGAQAADPTPPTAVKGHVPYPLPAGRGDRNGAAYRISVAFPPHQAPEAGMTQANGRIIRSAVPQLGNFSEESGISRV